MNQETLKKAIQALFAHCPPKKELSTQKIREFVAEYLSKPESDIEVEDLLAALRDTPFALAKPMLRGSSKLGWCFIQPSVSAKPSSPKRVKKPVRSKEKPLAQSQRLKR